VTRSVSERSSRATAWHGSLRCAALALAACLAAARADAQDDVAFVAQQHYDEGLRDYEADRFDSALEHFRASFGMTRSPNVRLMIARTLRNLGRLAEALIEYQLAHREAADRAVAEPRFAATRDAADSEGRAIEPRIGRVRVSIAERPPSLAIRVGGRSVPPEALDLAIPVDAGTVVVRASAPGHADAERQVEVAAGATATVSLVLEPRASTAIQDPDPSPEGLDPDGVTSLRGASGAEIAAWSASGVFAAGAAIAVALFVAAKSRYDGLVAACGAEPCPPSRAGEISEGRSFEAGAWVAVAIAGLAAIGATVAFVAWGGEPRERAVSFGPRGIGVRF
jgi:hypothetical protein